MESASKHYDEWKIFLKFWLKLCPQEQLNQNKEMKIADLILLSLFMRDNEKCNIPHAPYHQLKRHSILNTKCIGVIDPAGPEKKNNTEIYEVGATFTVSIINILSKQSC